MTDDNISKKQYKAFMIENSPALWQHLLRAPEPEANKYSRGFAFILGGEFMTGASALAARAAQRAGAGIVTLTCPKGAADVYRIVNPSTITLGFRDTLGYKEQLEDSRIHAYLVGPGLGDGPANTERIMAMIRRGKPMVLDADALMIMAATRENFLNLLDEYYTPESRRNILLTPHRGEFNALFPEYAALPADEAASAAANLFGTTILLKGHDSYIAEQTQELCKNAAASPWLATAGSGDVLSGLCLGLLAQGFSAYISACIATAIHAKAASEIGPGLIAEDLNDFIPLILAAFMD